MSKFFKPTKYNNETKNQLWMSIIADSHDGICDCPTPFAHLLDSIFPEGHRDRNKTIQHILDRDWRECHSGGQEEERIGGDAGEEEKDTQHVKREEEDSEQKDGDVEELLAAVAAAEAR